ENGLDAGTELWRQRLDKITSGDVESVLSEPAGSYSLRRLLTLISPAAENYIEQMAQLSHQLTVRRFGRTIRLYAPLYLSNYCSNSCRYCGFNKENKFERTRLTIDEAVEEANIIAGEGFRDILLVSSEDRKFVSVDYLAELARRLRGMFGSISIEVYQMSSAEYARSFEAGIDGVTLYQETYDRRAYKTYHPSGFKSDYDRRLSTPDNIASAQMREIGLGALLGLADWRIETLALAEHAHYLVKMYWQSHISFSFPRLRPAHQVEGSLFSHSFGDKNLVQMITALRLCFADAGLVLSTREQAGLRDNLMKLGITKISAGSKTSPGGYSGHSKAIEQFEVDDDRSPVEVAAVISNQGFEPVWKDWDRAFLGNQNGETGERKC
ncbi:MAG: 2-iminoacetate synthase ThiH, partial [Planctomycetota bacterium]|nr:2-iminoacetate synthase ThiH [Planctomycetota bacterium]